MQKTNMPVLITFGILAVIVVVVILRYFFIVRDSKAPVNIASTVNDKTFSVTTNSPSNETFSTVSSVKDALSMTPDEGIKCVRVNDNGNNPPGTVYIKGSRIMFEGGNVELMTTYTANGILKDSGLWIWEAESRSGTKMTIPQAQRKMIFDKMILGFDKYKQKCSPVVLEDNFFDPPYGISFNEV